jgi:predicted transcriptional regulator
MVSGMRSECIAEDIRRDTRTQYAIAAEYGISQATVSNIKRGKHYA